MKIRERGVQKERESRMGGGLYARVQLKMEEERKLRKNEGIWVKRRIN